MANLKNNKDSEHSIKHAITSFFDSIVDSYYKKDKKDLTTQDTTHKEKTALLDMLKSLFDTVRKVDDTSKESLEKTIFHKLSFVVKGFARLRVEDFFYATIINNLLLNVQDSNNIEEYGYTAQEVRKIEKTWRDLINKAKLIVRKQIKTKIDDRLITKSEYYSFSSGISKMSPALKTLVKDFEEHILLKECIKFLEDKRKEFFNENPVDDKRRLAT